MSSNSTTTTILTNNVDGTLTKSQLTYVIVGVAVFILGFCVVLFCCTKTKTKPQRSSSVRVKEARVVVERKPILGTRTNITPKDQQRLDFMREVEYQRNRLTTTYPFLIAEAKRANVKPRQSLDAQLAVPGITTGEREALELKRAQLDIDEKKKIDEMVRQQAAELAEFDRQVAAAQRARKFTNFKFDDTRSSALRPPQSLKEFETAQRQVLARLDREAVRDGARREAEYDSRVKSILTTLQLEAELAKKPFNLPQARAEARRRVDQYMRGAEEEEDARRKQLRRSQALELERFKSSNATASELARFRDAFVLLPRPPKPPTTVTVGDDDDDDGGMAVSAEKKKKLQIKESELRVLDNALEKERKDKLRSAEAEKADFRKEHPGPEFDEPFAELVARLEREMAALDQKHAKKRKMEEARLQRDVDKAK